MKKEGYCKGLCKHFNNQGATIYLWNYTKSKYDEKMKIVTFNEFWFNIIINSSELKHYINDNGEMIILVVQNGGARYGVSSVLGTDYICVIQIIKK